jgi:hypothetical protein
VIFADLMATFAFDGQVVIACAVVAANLRESIVVDLSVLVVADVGDAVVKYIGFHVFLRMDIDFFVVDLVLETIPL